TGVYVIIAYSVALRRREIGTRIALGASPRNILYLIFSQAARLVVLGICTGLLATASASRIIRTLLFGVHALDPWVICSVALLTSLVAICATLLPAFRASRTDPVVVLREC